MRGLSPAGRSFSIGLTAFLHASSNAMTSAAESQPHTQYVSEEDLESLVRAVLDRCPVAPDCTDKTVAALVDTDMFGISSHGVQQLPRYVQMLQSGAIDGFAEPGLIQDAGAIATLDAKHGMGHFATAVACELAATKAAAHGLCLISVRNSNHFGAAFPYCAGLAEAGLISFLATNAPPNMAPWGGRDRRIGNNPFSWGIPFEGNSPIVLDVACSIAAGSRLAFTEASKGTIPKDWALNELGEPTTDPAQVSSYLPMGDHKGYGLALINEILAGVLSGSSYSLGLPRREALGNTSWDVGHFLVAIDPSKLYDPLALAGNITSMVEMVRSSRVRPGFEKIWLPGEKEYQARAERSKMGVPLPLSLMVELNALAGR